MLALAVLGVAVPLVLWWLDRHRAELTISFEERISIGQLGRAAQAPLAFTANDTTVSDPTIAIIKLTNSGATPVTSQDVEVPLRITFENRVVATATEYRSPADLNATCTADQQAVVWNHGLLNPGDSATCVAVLEGEVSDPVVSGRILGVRDFVFKDAAAPGVATRLAIALSEPTRVTLAVIGAMGGALTLLISMFYLLVEAVPMSRRRRLTAEEIDQALSKDRLVETCRRLAIRGNEGDVLAVTLTGRCRGDWLFSRSLFEQGIRSLDPKRDGITQYLPQPDSVELKTLVDDTYDRMLRAVPDALQNLGCAAFSPLNLSQIMIYIRRMEDIKGHWQGDPEAIRDALDSAVRALDFSANHVGRMRLMLEGTWIFGILAVFGIIFGLVEIVAAILLIGST